MQPASREKKKKDVIPLPKHGAHEKHPEAPTNANDDVPFDPEDPQWSPNTDPSFDPWENLDERELRSEAEDPDSPQTL